jgi:hypothetical protein
MNESSILQGIIQGGAVGLAAFSLWIIYKITNAQQATLIKIAEDHRQTIDRNTNAWLRNTEAVAKLQESIEHMKS